VAVRADGSVLSRLRAIFLLWALVTAVGTAINVATSPSASTVPRVGIAAALLVLAGYWMFGWARGRFSAWLEPLEWAVIASVGFVCTFGSTSSAGALSLAGEPLVMRRRPSLADHLLFASCRR